MNLIAMKSACEWTTQTLSIYLQSLVYTHYQELNSWLSGLLYFWPKECLLSTNFMRVGGGKAFIAFEANRPLYQFTRIQFGLTNGVDTF